MSELARLLLASALTLLSPITLLVTGIVVAVWLTTLCRARWFMLPGLLLAGIFWLTHDRTTLVTKTLTAWQQLFAEPTAWHLLPFVPLGLPLGLVAGGLVIAYKDGQLCSQEWHPLAYKRQEQHERRLKRRMRK